MRSGSSDKVKGKIQQAAGTLKAAAGKALDNPKLQAKGTAQKLAGKAQAKVGQVKKVFGK